jgi:hypothetical protein
MGLRGLEVKTLHTLGVTTGERVVERARKKLKYLAQFLCLSILLARVLVYGLYNCAWLWGGKDCGCSGHRVRREESSERDDTLAAVLMLGSDMAHTN